MKCVRAGELLKRSDTTDTSKESRLLCHADFLSHTDILFPLTSDFSWVLILIFSVFCFEGTSTTTGPVVFKRVLFNIQNWSIRRLVYRPLYTLRSFYES